MTEALWTPSKERIENSQMSAFMHSVNKAYGLDIKSYQELHYFSVKSKDKFWVHLINFFKLEYSGNLQNVLSQEGFEKYSWFPDLKLNFAENLLKKGLDQNIAIELQHESGLVKNISYKELRSNVAFLSAFLKTIVGPSDVVAAYMPNIPETVITMLAATSFGGVFTSTSCDFGVAGVLDRFLQSKPKVLVVVIGYEYNGKYIDLHDKLVEIEAGLPELEKLLIVDFLNRGVDLSRFKKAMLFSDALKSLEFVPELSFTRLPFSHPLYIMYSSGTTGKPKCIVHSQGGTLVQLVKELGLHTDLTAEKKIFFFTTCGWMMWNWLVAALSFGSTVVLYEGAPTFPSPQHFFNIIKRSGINIFGTSPKFLKVIEDTSVKFEDEYPELETILSTGSPLLPEQYDFVYSKIKKDVLLASISGGTDIISCFMLGNPILPVYRGEIQCRGLGMDVQVLDENKKSVKETEGELVCASTFPSRPLYFLNDSDGSLIKSAYFDQNPGVWTHGDFVKLTDHGGVIVYGRSDATLNPGGVRIGTAEIYRQTESLSYVQDSLCVGRPHEGDVDVILFIKLKANEELSLDRKKQIKELIKKNTTARHVPKEIVAISDIPYTRSGKKVELAVSRILAGKPVTNLEALANPESLNEYYNFKA
jgi:acetoacetyl-CoA synthetase